MNPFTATDLRQKQQETFIDDTFIDTCIARASESALAAAGRTGIAPDRPVVVAAAARQLNFRDEYHPLSRPLPLHLAKLAEEYFLPLAVAPASAPEAGQDSEQPPVT